MDRGFGGRDRYDDRSRDYDRGEMFPKDRWGAGSRGQAQPRRPAWPSSPPVAGEGVRKRSGCSSSPGSFNPRPRSSPSRFPPTGYDSRIGSGRRAFGSGYRRDDDYRGCGDRYEDRYDRRDDRMDRWNSRDDYGRDDFRREDRGKGFSWAGARPPPARGGIGADSRGAFAPSQVPPRGRS